MTEASAKVRRNSNATRRGYGSARVAADLAAIPDLTRDELIERWAAAYSRPPPKGLSRRLLEYSAAYHVQAEVYGGPSPAQQVKLRRANGSGIDEAAASKPRDLISKTPPPGSRLVREWHGRTYTVEVLDKGFLCDQQHYRSLSEVARAITGARWSGPRFFGL